jgi:hypothetical protein
MSAGMKESLGLDDDGRMKGGSAQPTTRKNYLESFIFYFSGSVLNNHDTYNPGVWSYTVQFNQLQTRVIAEEHNGSGHIPQEYSLDFPRQPQL